MEGHAQYISDISQSRRVCCIVLYGADIRHRLDKHAAKHYDRQPVYAYMLMAEVDWERQMGRLATRLEQAGAYERKKD